MLLVPPGLTRSLKNRAGTGFLLLRALGFYIQLYVGIKLTLPFHCWKQGQALVRLASLTAENYSLIKHSWTSYKTICWNQVNATVPLWKRGPVLVRLTRKGKVIYLLKTLGLLTTICNDVVNGIVSMMEIRPTLFRPAHSVQTHSLSLLDINSTLMIKRLQSLKT